MEFSTNHDVAENNSEFWLQFLEETEEGINSANVIVRINDFIDSRTELNIEIRKRGLAFLKRAVAQLEEELKDK